MTATVVKITNIPLGIDEMEFAHLLLDAMEAQASSIKDTFLSCQILHRDSIAVLEFEPSANCHLQWSNLENINIDGKSLQVISILNPIQEDQPVVSNGFGMPSSHITNEEEKMDVDEGVGSGSGESSPMVPEGNEEFLKMLGGPNFPVSVTPENTVKDDEGKVESPTVNQPSTLLAQPEPEPEPAPSIPLSPAPAPSPSFQPAPTVTSAPIISRPSDKPSAAVKPNIKPAPQAIKPVVQKTSRVVFFDLETTGLDKTMCEIVQIAAMSGPKHFNVYIKPLNGIPPDASRINGLTVVQGKLCKNGQVVETQDALVAWKGFLEFLKSLDHVILMGHNAHWFDFPLLVRDIKRLGLLQELQSIVTGCVDTIQVFKAKLPHRVKRRLSFKQVDLAEEYKINTNAAHDALGDVRMLSQLCQKIGLSSQDIANHRKMLKCY